MGCDIHICTERRDPVTGKWWSWPEMTKEVEITNNPSWGKTVDTYYPQTSILDVSRNYVLFGILAQVRNSLFPSISEPRGIPEDACLIIKEYLNSYGEDGHSHSYLTFDELLAYPWEETIILEGVTGRVDTFDAAVSQWGLNKGTYDRQYPIKQPYRDGIPHAVDLAADAVASLGLPPVKAENVKEYSRDHRVVGRCANSTDNPYVWFTADVTPSVYCEDFITQLQDALDDGEDPANYRMSFFFDN